MWRELNRLHFAGEQLPDSNKLYILLIDTRHNHTPARGQPGVYVSTQKLGEGSGKNSVSSP